METASPQSSPRLGEILLQYRLIQPEQLDQALTLQKTCKERIGVILVKQGWVSEDDILYVLSQQLNLPYVQLSTDMIDLELVRSFPKDFMVEYNFLPLIRVENNLTVAFADPTDHEVLAEINKLSNCQILTSLAKSSSIQQMLEYVFGPSFKTDMEEVSFPATTIRQAFQDFFRGQIQKAIDKQATEITFLPHMDKVTIHFHTTTDQIAGESLSWSEYKDFLYRLKLFFNFGLQEENVVSQKTSPLILDSQKLEITAILVPSLYGKSITLKIHQTPAKSGNVADLIPDPLLARLRPLLDCHRGIIFISSLNPNLRFQLSYNLLNQFIAPTRKIATIEKRIFYPNDNFIQTYTEPYNSSNVNALFEQISQMPYEVILLEYQDSASLMKMIFNASLNNRLILVLLNFRNASDVFYLFQSKNILSAEIANGFLASLALEQFPSLCPFCAESVPSTKVNIGQKKTSKKEALIKEKKGCGHCNNSGYSGNKILTELILNSAELSNIIKTNAGLDKILPMAIKEGFPSIQDQLLEGIDKGIFSQDDIQKEYPLLFLK